MLYTSSTSIDQLYNDAMTNRNTLQLPIKGRFPSLHNDVFSECTRCIWDKNVVKLEQLVDKHTNIRNNSHTLLQYVIFNKYIDVLVMLLSHKNIIVTQHNMDFIIANYCGYDINKIFSSLPLFKNKINVDECFTKMVNNNNISVDVLKSLINEVNINYKDKMGNTPLLYAIKNNDIDKVSFIVSQPNINIMVNNLHGQNAFMMVIEQSNYEHLAILIDQFKTHELFKVIINQSNKNNETPILLATKNNHTELFKIIYDHGVNLNCVDINGNSLLHYAIKNNNNEIFELLVNDVTINVNIQDYDGMTPLMLCINNNDADKIYRLLNCEKLDLNVVNNLGQNVIDIVIKQKYSTIKINKPIELFGSNHYKDGFAHLDECYEMLATGNNNNTNNTCDHDDLIKLFIQKNINLNNFDINNKSILTYVIDNDDCDLFNVLLNCELLDVNARDSVGNTYLMYLFNLMNKKNVVVKPQRRIVSDTWLESPIKCEPLIKGRDLRIGVAGYEKPQTEFGDFDTIKFNSSKLEAPNFMDDGITKMDINPINDFVSNAIINDNKHYLTFFTQLLNHPKININTQNYLNQTILSMIVITTDSNLLMRVIKCKNIDLNIMDHNGDTPFMLAIKNKLWTNVKMLLMNGANIHNGDIMLDGNDLFIYETLVKSFVKKVEKESGDCSSNTIITKKGWIY